jgi:hypothetical protein
MNSIPLKEWGRRALLSAAVLAAFAPMAFANPCDTDLEPGSVDVRPGVGAVTSCLQKYKGQVSFGCREWIHANLPVLKRVKSACDHSARQYCGDEAPGYGRVKNCLMANFDKIPHQCQNALKELGD